jgi:hypothetical protein
VLVKCGAQSEQGSPRAGNRGKRDSQLLFSGLLNRFHHGRKLNELDKAIKNALDHLQLPLDQVRYLMAIDADTRVDRESISHMTYSMNKNDQILALCGETKVDNKSQTWVTMIQVFEYYTNHHMKKAFESVFGCVTCLPGCFTSKFYVFVVRNVHYLFHDWKLTLPGGISISNSVQCTDSSAMMVVLYYRATTSINVTQSTMSDPFMKRTSITLEKTGC